jgi:hypothetical protein
MMIDVSLAHRVRMLYFDYLSISSAYISNALINARIILKLYTCFTSPRSV